VRWKQQLNRELAPLSIIMVDERYSSLEGAIAIGRCTPGLFRLLPRGLRLPPRAVDDIVAILLIERYLERLVA